MTVHKGGENPRVAPSPLAWLALAFLGLLALGQPQARAGTEAQRTLTLGAEDIDSLLEAVARGDKDVRRASAARLQQRLDSLDEDLKALPSLSLSVGGDPIELKYVGDELQPEALAGDLVVQEQLAADLAALRTQTIPSRLYTLTHGEQVELRYYSPGGMFVARDVGEEGQATGFDLYSLLRAEQRITAMADRSQRLRTAAGRSDMLTVAVVPSIQARLGLSDAEMTIAYVDSGVVATGNAPDRGYPALLEEVRRQLEYILNVKDEGPPLLRALRTGLYFNGELGFAAWGGRWAEFGGKVFFFRHDPVDNLYLVNLREP